MMLPPVSKSRPFRLVFFVLVDAWSPGSLVESNMDSPPPGSLWPQAAA